MSRPRFEDTLGLLPAVQHRFFDLEREIWAAGRCDHAIVDLCQRRVAQLLGDTYAAGSAIDVEALDARLRSCLAFAELFVLDPHALTDRDTADLLTHLTPAEATAMTMALAVFDATSRARVALTAVL